MNPREVEPALLEAAREAIRGEFTSGESYSPHNVTRNDFEEFFRSCGGCSGIFVTLRQNGELRGGIGQIGEVDRPVDLIQRMAVSSAKRDPRFPPLETRELPKTDIEISILHRPRPASAGELDPRKYGIIVTSGRKRGVLLPDIPEVTTPVMQMDIAKKKAGIEPGEPFELEIFEVTKVSETRGSAS